MNFLKNFLILIIITTFSLGCMEKNNVKTFENSKTSIKEELLIAETGGVFVSFSSFLVKWKNSKGEYSSKYKTSNWSWELPLNYEFYLYEDSKNFWKNKYSKYGEMGKRYFLEDAHFTEMKKKYSSYFSKNDIMKLKYKLEKKEGFLTAEVPYISLTSVVEDSRLWRGKDIFTTLFFKNLQGKWCVLRLVNIDGKNPVNLLEEVVDVYVAPEHISTAKSTNNQG